MLWRTYSDLQGTGCSGTRRARPGVGLRGSERGAVWGARGGGGQCRVTQQSQGCVCLSPRETTTCVHSPPQNVHRQRPEGPSARTPVCNRTVLSCSVPFKAGRWSGQPATETASGMAVSRAGGWGRWCDGGDGEWRGVPFAGEESVLREDSGVCTRQGVNREPPGCVIYREA